MEVIMIDRIIAAFTFKQGVYKEVEEDVSFTSTAWVIVAVVAFLSNLGSNAVSSHSIGSGWIIGALVSTLFAVGAFALGCFVISWAGKTFFEADVTFDELVRTLGLAYVWKVIGFLGIIALAAPGLACVTGPISFLANLAGLVAWFMAAKEALDMEWPQTIGTVIIGWVVMTVVMAIAGVFLGLLGLAGAGVGALFRAF
jgi:hypothetical protein